MEEQEEVRFEIPVELYDLPAEKQPAWFKIFYYTFNVNIQQAHLYSEREISEYGVPSSGDAATDREMAQERMWCPSTLDQIIEWHRQGLRLQFASTEDMVTIYEILQRHLLDWQEELTSDWPRAPNLDDLKVIEKFAEHLYKSVRGDIGVVEAQQDVFANLMHLGVNPMTGSGVDQIQARRNEAEYKPLVPDLAMALQRRKQWR